MVFRLARQRVTWLLSLLLGLSACTSAPKPTPASEQTAARRDTPGLFLYEVAGSKGTSYLLGTIHVGFGFEEVLTPRARQKFESSARVMTEADISAANPEQLIQAALLPPDRSLRTILGEPTWAKLLSRIGAQIPAPMLERLEPWLPTVMLGLDELERALTKLKPGSEARMMDVELMKRAAELDKELHYFETVEEQIALFDSIALEEQVRELARGLEGDSSQQATALLESFAAGDEAALSAALFDAEQLKSAPGFYQRVLFDRNARWLPIMQREVDRGSAFIAVGAGHLLGEHGVLAELARKGYRVTRVSE
jgi:uncharacterized protein